MVKVQSSAKVWENVHFCKCLFTDSFVVSYLSDLSHQELQ